MIDVILLTLIGLWICYAVYKSRKKWKKRMGRLFVILSALLLELLLAESLLLYGKSAPLLLADNVLYSSALLLSVPLSFEPFRERVWIRFGVVTVLSLVLTAVPRMTGCSFVVVHCWTALALLLILFVESLVALVCWIRSQDALRMVNALLMVELWIRCLDALLLALTAIGLVIASEGPWICLPLAVGAMSYVFLYYRCVKGSALSPLGWMRRMITVETSESNPPLSDEYYKAVYKKCCHFMEVKKPFLVESFSLADLAQGVFTNTSYVSRALHKGGEVNFRRFVNRYRVAYAQEIFMKNKSLRVSDLMMLSGINSLQTFCTIFKLFTGQTPRQWCSRIRSQP